MENKLFEFIEKYIPLTADEEDALNPLNLFCTVKKGIVLLKEGQYSTESYFVLKGCIRSFYIVNGEEKTTEFYTEMPESFKQLDDKYSKFFFGEPGLHFGINF